MITRGVENVANMEKIRNEHQIFIGKAQEN